MQKKTLVLIQVVVLGLCMAVWQPVQPNGEGAPTAAHLDEQESSAKKPLSVSALAPSSSEGSWSAGRALNGTPLNIGGIVYSHGIGSAVPSRLTYDIPEGFSRLEAWVGFDITSSDGEGRLRILVDGNLAFDTGTIEFQNFSRGPGVNPDRAIKVSVPVDGASKVTLKAEGTKGKLFANWAEVRLLPRGWPEYRLRPAEKTKADVPPMGWNSWNAFGTEINEEKIQQIADKLVQEGYQEAGYRYLNLDDGWQAKSHRDSAGYPVYNKQKFPNGMKTLGDYIHQKGLKFGIYSRPDWVGGSWLDGLWTGGNEQKHAERFAEWGVDYLKYDFGEKMSFYHMGEALGKIDRPIVYSVCGWGKEQEWQWASGFGGNLWRTTYDVMAVWETGSDGNPVGIMDAVDQTEALGKFAGPGRWNDPDMLVIGLDGGTAVQQMHQKKTTGLSVIEERSQMSLYALLSAPLIIGADIRKIDSSAKEILLNKEVIAVNQDPLGIPGWRVLKLDELEVWKKPLEDGDYAIGLLNRGSESQNITATWRQLNLSGKYMARDLWKHKDLGTYSEKISRSIKPHQTILLRITPQK